MYSNMFYMFSAHGKSGLKWYQMRLGGLFPTNQDLAIIQGDMDFDFKKTYFVFFSELQISQILDFQVSRFAEIRGGPGLGRASLGQACLRVGRGP